MTKIKIRSNPYNREISYLTMDEATGQWVDVRETDERSRLRETDSERSFLPFKIKEIITIIIKEYYVGREKVQLYFEGTQDEYYEVEAVCESDDVKDKIELIRTNTILENARFIKGDIKEVFERVNPVIENIMKEDFSVKRGLNKVSQALDDVIPLCVFGNYSAGKSTFINALIGVELLPSGGDPVTAKIYEIRNSEFFDQAKISFEFHGERIEISIEGKEFRVLKGDSETDIVKSIKEEIDNEGSHELYAMVRTEKPFMFDPDDNDLDNYCKTEVEESLLNCIMEKEILRRGNKTDLKALKSKIIKSKLETCVKRDFMEYLEHDGENAIETLRKLIYDFLSAENAIIEAKQCNDIVEWTRTVVDRLNPSLRAYPNKQIDLALALILYEQTLRDASYGSVFCKFTEVYKNEGGVF